MVKLLLREDYKFMILMTLLMFVAIGANFVYIYAQQVDFENGTNTDSDTPGSTIMAFLTAISSIIIAILAFLSNILRTRHLRGKIDNNTFENIDMIQSILQKFMTKSEINKQILDVLYYQLLPEQAKSIYDANAIKIKNINKILEKDADAVQELNVLTQKWKAGDITDPVTLSTLAKSVVARSQQKTDIVPEDASHTAHKLLLKKEYPDTNTGTGTTS